MLETAFLRFQRKFTDHGLRAMRFQKTLSAVEWSEEIRRMEGGRPFSFEFAPYEREMMETPFDPEVQMTVYMMASRLGKTEVIMCIIGHGTHERRRRILVMYPTISQAEKWSKETLMNELVYPTPELDELIGDGAGRRKSGNTILHKVFPGGLLNAFGANAPGEMRRSKGNLLLADEIDAIGGTETDEGDPLEIFWVRGSEYPDAVKIAASYPSIKGRSNIERLMLRSDYRQWFTPCWHCESEFVLERSQLRYESEEPESAWLECPEKGCRIDDEQRLEMVKAGRWNATRDFAGIAGFQASRMISPHPVQKGFASHLHWAAVEEIKVETAANPERARRVLVNTFDGMPYTVPQEEKPDPGAVFKRREDYDPSEQIPGGVLAIVIGADTQADRIEMEWIGCGENQETWGLGYEVIYGNPEHQPVWNEFEKRINREFNHPSGKKIKAACTAIDSRYRPDFVRHFTRARTHRRIHAVYGSTVLGKDIVSKPKKVGRPPAPVFEIGTHEAKSIIYHRAALTRLSESDAYPTGFMHFTKAPAAGYDEKYFAGLFSEDCQLKKASDGDYYEHFVCPQGIRNEPLDCRVYGMAAEKILRVNYEKLKANIWGEKPSEKTPRKR